MREPNQAITLELPEKLQEPNQIFGQRQYNTNLDFTATDKTIFVQYREKNFKLQPQSIQLYKVIDDSKLELVNQFDWTRKA